ncbi:50S ribosomal protein L29 [Candidatus Woesearchaeota archaeon]|jgi:ribosomal protein L29|nr:50S ribosomal protein L29 [Candidatus Woesearchaeota archaeon]MBT4058114.1 50S ribosomal protein L29 [Candidatus Woesearchaeota archaeon]MBT4208943.1 50S ribosomal protein L29 [Candidatus Woesearchaeota archaeon]MBT4732438.1 50S ribosomal protein L29 [Candidatus Woesearchaeota archaeon]MBT4783025.1 50S ribosomal protein L29 [Candidatus Woesearchaeota archaeon]
MLIKKKELAQLNLEQLGKKGSELKKELMKLNMQRASGTPPENPGLIKATRKAIARINTYITQKENAPATEVKEKKVVKRVVKKVVKKSSSQKTKEVEKKA